MGKMLKPEYDGKFTAFMLLSQFVDELGVAWGFPAGWQHNHASADLVHSYADKIAKELLNGKYVYSKPR